MDPASIVESIARQLGLSPPPVYLDPKLPVPGRWVGNPETGFSAIYINPRKVDGVPMEFVLAHEMFHEYVFRKGLKYPSILDEERAANEFARQVTGYYWMNYTHLESLKPVLVGILTGMVLPLGVVIGAKR